MLVSLKLLDSSTVAEMLPVFKGIAAATGGEDGPRGLPTTASSSTPDTSVVEHLRNCVHLWQVICMNVDAQVAEKLRREELAAQERVEAAKTAYPDPSAALDRTAATIAAGMQNFNASFQTFSAAAKDRSRKADLPIRFFLFHEGALHWVDDFSAPPLISDIQVQLSSLVSGGDLNEAYIRLLVNCRHGWDPLWFRPFAASDLEELHDGWEALAKAAEWGLGVVMSHRVMVLRDRLKLYKRCGWSPQQAYEWSRMAWSYFCDDVQTIFADSISFAPLQLPGGGEESKAAFLHRVLPRPGEPMQADAAGNLQLLMDGFRAEKLAKAIEARVVLDAGKVAPAKRKGLEVRSDPVGDGPPPAKKPKRVKVDIDRRKFVAKYGPTVCVLHALGACHFKAKCKFEHKVTLDEAARKELALDPPSAEPGTPSSEVAEK